MDEVVAPVFQLYVAAPLPVSVALLPAQRTVPVDEMLTTGRGLTEMLLTAVFEHPVAASVPFTVKVALAAGVTT
jgi:hypothetical protein